MSDPSITLTDQLFRRFLAVYGNRFTRMWEGLDIADVKAQWEAELGRFDLGAIRHALDHLPESNPPTLLEFRALCNRAPREEAPRLPAPTGGRSQAATKLLADVMRAVKAMEDGPRAWAYRLRAREQGGERLTTAQRDAWRAALRRDTRDGAGREAA